METTLNFRIAPVVVLLFATQLSTTCSGQCSECGSFFTGLQANALAVERFDVSLATEALKADNRDFRLAERLILDTTQQRALLLRNRTVRDLGTDKQSVTLEAFLALGDTTWHRSIQVGLRSASIPFEKALKVSGFTDIRLIGAMPFPTAIGSDYLDGVMTSNFSFEMLTHMAESSKIRKRRD